MSDDKFTQIRILQKSIYEELEYIFSKLSSKSISFLTIVLSMVVFLLFPGFSLAYQARNYYGGKLEPVDKVMHVAGQSPSDFNDYWNVMDSGEYPACYMAYCGLTSSFDALRADLENYVQTYGAYLPVQLGLYIVGIEDEIAAGLWDADIERFCRELNRLGYPLYIRIGYECNGAHNGYDPTDYKAAFIRITNALRANNVEAATVFNVIQGPYSSYYPGDAYVDWMSINAFSVWNVEHPDTYAFLDDAHTRGKPVLIGEADPTYWHTDQGQASWDGYFVPYFNLIDSYPGIKNFCYINADWRGTSLPDWGDCRLQSNAIVAQNYRDQMDSSLYMHSLDEAALRSEITGVSDDIAPGKVTGLVAETNDSPVVLSWDIASDNNGINRYQVVRDGILAGYNTTTSFEDTGVFAGKTYIYQVTAIDKGGNRGPASDSIMVVISPGIEKIINGQFNQGRAPWQTGIYAGGCSLSSSIDTTSKLSGVNSIKLYVSQASGTNWHIQFYQDFKTRQNFTYELTYTAVADQSTPLGVIMQERHWPFDVFTSHNVTLTTTPQTFTLSGVAPDDDTVAVSFMLASAAPRTIWLDNISIVETSNNPDPQNCTQVQSLGLDLSSDFTGDCYVNFEDFQVLAGYWLYTDCGIHDDCQGADFEPDGDVDPADLEAFALEWLNCNSPQDTSCEPTW